MTANITDQVWTVLAENKDTSVEPVLINDKELQRNGTDGHFGIPTDKKILYQVFALALSLMVIYVTFALLLYNWLKSSCHQQRVRSSIKRGGTARRRGRKDSGGTSDSSTSTAHSSCRPKSTAARNARILRIMCTCGSVLTLVRLASEQMELLPAGDVRVKCRDYQIAMVVTYCFAISMLYGILWYRVRVFLSHPAMRHLGSKVLTVLVFIVLGIIIVASVVNASMFLATTVSYDAYGGCVVFSPGDVLSNSSRFAILTISTVVSQVSLLGLFLYPLVRHNAAMRAGRISTPVTPKKIENGSVKVTRTQSFRNTLSPATLTRTLTRGRNTTRRLRREQALLKIIRRVLITAVICALSDIFCGLIVRLVSEKPRVVTNLIFDVNLVVNLACVLMSFKDWRVRMFPCCVPERKQEEPGTEAGKQPLSPRDRKLPNLTEAQVPSSPAPFTSRESTATRGMYPTSESGNHSPSPGEDESRDFDKGIPANARVSEDTGHGKSV